VREGEAKTEGKKEVMKRENGQEGRGERRKEHAAKYRQIMPEL
jgi:hypothetical protein